MSRGIMVSALSAGVVSNCTNLLLVYSIFFVVECTNVIYNGHTPYSEIFSSWHANNLPNSVSRPALDNPHVTFLSVVTMVTILFPWAVCCC